MTLLASDNEHGRQVPWAYFLLHPRALRRHPQSCIQKESAHGSDRAQCHGSLSVTFRQSAESL